MWTETRFEIVSGMGSTYEMILDCEISYEIVLGKRDNWETCLNLSISSCCSAEYSSWKKSKTIVQHEYYRRISKHLASSFISVGVKILQVVLLQAEQTCVCLLETNPKTSFILWRKTIYFGPVSIRPNTCSTEREDDIREPERLLVGDVSARKARLDKVKVCKLDFCQRKLRLQSILLSMIRKIENSKPWYGPFHAIGWPFSITLGKDIAYIQIHRS